MRGLVVNAKLFQKEGWKMQLKSWETQSGLFRGDHESQERVVPGSQRLSHRRMRLLPFDA